MPQKNVFLITLSLAANSAEHFPPFERGKIRWNGLWILYVTAHLLKKKSNIWMNGQRTHL